MIIISKTHKERILKIIFSTLVPSILYEKQREANLIIIHTYSLNYPAHHIEIQFFILLPTCKSRVKNDSLFSWINQLDKYCCCRCMHL